MTIMIITIIVCITLVALAIISAILYCLKDKSDKEYNEYCNPFEINLVKKLSSLDILSPLKFNDAEWNLCYDNVYQNTRKSSIFKHGDRIKDINAFVKTPVQRYSYKTKKMV